MMQKVYIYIKKNDQKSNGSFKSNQCPKTMCRHMNNNMSHVLSLLQLSRIQAQKLWKPVFVAMGAKRPAAATPTKATLQKERKKEEEETDTEGNKASETPKSAALAIPKTPQKVQGKVAKAKASPKVAAKTKAKAAAKKAAAKKKDVKKAVLKKPSSNQQGGGNGNNKGGSKETLQQQTDLGPAGEQRGCLRGGIGL
jgi:hypothetical protein